MLKSDIFQCSLEHLNKRHSRVFHYSTLSQYKCYNIVSPFHIFRYLALNLLNVSLDNNLKKKKLIGTGMYAYVKKANNNKHILR